MAYTIAPIPSSAIPKVMTKRSNWVSISRQDIKPKNGIVKNFSSRKSDGKSRTVQNNK